MKGGALYEDFTRGFGHDGPDLPSGASSLLMNPSLRAGRLERERRLCCATCKCAGIWTGCSQVSEADRGGLRLASATRRL
jgi:hypothetical protein